MTFQALMLANASVLVVNSENLHILQEGLLAMHKDFKQLLREQEATEARHAAELREQAERFSEVAARMVAMAEEDCSSLWAGVTRQILAPFILPAPDPLVELAREMTLLDGVVRTDNQKAAIRAGRAGNTASDDFYDRLRTALASRQYEVRKIGEAGE